MDPTETYNDIMESLAHDRDSAIQAALCLQEWLDKGGFMPDIPEEEMVRVLWWACEGVARSIEN